MQNFDFRQEVAELLQKFVPSPAGSLASPAKMPQPHAPHFVPECSQAILVARYSVVPEVSANHRLQPFHHVCPLVLHYARVQPFQYQADEPFISNPVPYELLHLIMSDFIEK